MTVIIGIDPGLCKTGWAVIEWNGGDKVSRLSSGVISGSTDSHDARRLLAIYQNLRKVCIEFKPMYGGIEITYVNINKRSSLKLAQARAAAMIACAESMVILEEFDAKEVKKTLTGYGNASKGDVYRELSKVIGGINGVEVEKKDGYAIDLSKNKSTIIKISTSEYGSIVNSGDFRSGIKKITEKRIKQDFVGDIGGSDESDAIAIAFCKLQSLRSKF